MLQRGKRVLLSEELMTDIKKNFLQSANGWHAISMYMDISVENGVLSSRRLKKGKKW